MGIGNLVLVGLVNAPPFIGVLRTIDDTGNVTESLAGLDNIELFGSFRDWDRLRGKGGSRWTSHCILERRQGD